MINKKFRDLSIDERINYIKIFYNISESNMGILKDHDSLTDKTLEILFQLLNIH